MKSLRNTQGFSLVELMVVVAIIGILAALSVGQVQKQIAKSRQSEAKTNLASLYTAEKSLYAEFAAYSDDFGILSFGLEGNVRYNVGFASVTTGAPSGYTGAAASGKFDAKGICTGTPCAIIDSNGVTPAALAKNASATTFNAQADAYIYNNAGSKHDIWEMTQDKLISNTQAGIY